MINRTLKNPPKRQPLKKRTFKNGRKKKKLIKLLSKKRLKQIQRHRRKIRTKKIVTKSPVLILGMGFLAILKERKNKYQANI